MALVRYSGLSPKNVSKDAKYSVRTDGQIKLEYYESQRVKVLVTTNPGEHQDLVKMVNAVKLEVNHTEGGAFYINEFHDVLVPDGAGGPCYYAGTYDGTLVFRGEGIEVGPKAPPDLQPGDVWPGPHAGVAYRLKAGARDITYDRIDGRRSEEIHLSEVRGVGAPEAAALAGRLARVKGSQGGRIYINECNEFFAPVGVAGDYTYRYLGSLEEDDPWFLPPDGFERP